MIFCDRKDCEFNDDGACENPDNITLDDTGTCTDKDADEILTKESANLITAYMPYFEPEPYKKGE